MNIKNKKIFNELSGVFNEIFFLDGFILLETTSQKDIPAWDSFNHINLVIAIEERFGIKISMQKIQELKTVDDLIHEISRQIN